MGGMTHALALGARTVAMIIRYTRASGVPDSVGGIEFALASGSRDGSRRNPPQDASGFVVGYIRWLPYGVDG